MPVSPRYPARLAAAAFVHCALLTGVMLIPRQASAQVIATSQAAPPSYWHGNLQQTGWSKKDGAPSSVYSMTQDADGMLWFAARDGLYRFDGAKFERTDQVDGNQLLSPITLCVDAFDGALWVGYQLGGVSVFDHGKVRHYQEAQGVQAGSVFHFGKMPGGIMWLSSTSGMYWLDGAMWRHAGKDDGLPDGFANPFNILRDGSLLVYFPDGVYQSTPNGHTFRRVLAQPGVEGGELRPDGLVLINSQRDGMQLFDPASGAVTPFALHNDKLPMQGYASDRRGALWVSVGSGIELLDATQHPLKTFTPARGLVGKTFSSMLDDREGNMWLATEAGINRVRQTRLTAVELPEGVTDALSVMAGDDGAVWINNMFNHGAFKVPTFSLDAQGRRSDSELVNVTASYRHRDGGNWFGNSQFLWRIQGGKMQQWPKPEQQQGRPIHAIAMDTGGTVWLSVIGKGVYSFRDGAWLERGGRADLKPGTAISLLGDAQGSVWFGYPGNRVAQLEHDTVRQFGAADGLEIGNVLAMSRRGQRLWLGGDRGVAYLDGKRFVTLKDMDGKDFRGVSGLVETAAGELWLHGVDGLIRIGAADLARPGPGSGGVAAERFNFLDGHEGTPAQVGPLPTLTQASDGKLWYATSGSVGWIDPAHIAHNPVAPSALVTLVKTDQRSYLPGAGLALPKYTDHLEIDFTAALLSIPERARFRYRLAGLETHWRDSEGRRQAFYTNLGPGDYRFEVSAANEDGVWSATPAVLALRIEPGLTQTIWFKLACGAAALTLAYLLYLWRLARATARIAERLQERAHERERIARTLHDTFLQSVQALILRFHLIKSALPAGDATQRQIDSALKAADAVLAEGRDQVMDLRVGSQDHAQVQDLAQALSDAGRALAADHAVAFSLAVTGSARRLAPAVHDEVFAIGREALFNAFRHATGSDVRVTLDYNAASFRLAVRDQGPGLAPQVREAGHRSGHWGLTGMRERAQRIGATLVIDSQAGVGTEVRLSIPGKLAYA